MAIQDQVERIRQEINNTDRAHMSNINMSRFERLVYLVVSPLLIVGGIVRGNIGGFMMTVLGGFGLYKAVTGSSPEYRALGISTATHGNKERVSVPHEQGIHISKAVTINRTPEEVYAFWRNFENLPRFMNHLESVQVQDSRRSHWVAKAPVGMTVSWDAEIINDIPGEVIAWRSLADAQVANAGSVRFNAAPGGRGTEVRVEMEYTPPAGAVGAFVARMFGEEPTIQVEDDLRRFKQILETGETPTTEGQPSGRV